MSAQHTPGPWEWDGITLQPAIKNPDSSAVFSILDREGGYGFMGSDRRATSAELDADYALIAAAPELLDIATRVEALLARQKWTADGDSPESVLLRDARAAIGKVYGS